MSHTAKSQARIIARSYNAGSRLAVLAFAAATSLPTIAQEDSATSDGALETVVVTARYREESLQTTPLAVTAFTGFELEARSIESTADLGAVIPNLYTHPGDQVWGTTPTISLRGVTAEQYSFARDPAVGIYIDDVYHSTLVGADLDLTDIERVEVRRGPQGTLAGNASIAGTISIYSRPPQGDDTGFASISYGEFDHVEARGGFDTALATNLFMRVSGKMSRKDGYVDQLDFTCEMNRLGTPELAGSFPTRDNSSFMKDCKIGTFGGENEGAAKMMLRYVPSDRLEFNLAGSYYNLDGEMQPNILLRTNPPLSAQHITDELFARYGIVFDERFLRPPGREYSTYSTTCQPLTGICDENEEGQYSRDWSLKADYDLTDNVHLKVIGAVSRYGGVGTHNGEASPLGYNLSQVFFRTEQSTAEVRFNGRSLSNRLDWVGGVFFLSSENNLSGHINIPSSVFTEDDDFTTDSRSAFMHGDYAVTDKLTVSLGVRYSNFEKSAALDHAGLLDDITPFSLEDSRWDWLVGAKYQFTDDLMGYATVSTGSRPAGISTIVFTKDQLSFVPAEELTAYEIGLKSELLNGRLRLNVNAFYSDYSKRLTGQTQFQCLSGPFAGPPPTPVYFAEDCGANPFVPWPHTIGTPAEVVGFEWELTARPIAGLFVSFQGGTNRFESKVKTPGEPGFIYPGNVPQPERNMAAGIGYRIDFAGGAITPRLDWLYQSKSTFGPSASNQPPTPLFTVPGRTIVNGQIEYAPTNEAWRISLNVSNLTDKFYLYNVFSGSGTAVTGNVAPPRQWTLTLRREF